MTKEESLIFLTQCGNDIENAGKNEIAKMKEINAKYSEGTGGNMLEERISELEEIVKKQKAIIKELKDDLVEIRVDKIRATVPQGHCPSAYYPSLINRDESEYCESGDCGACKQNFYQQVEERFRKELTEAIERWLA